MTLPSGDTLGGNKGYSLIRDIARDAGRLDDGRTRELLGEARMMDLIEEHLDRRLGACMAAGTLTDQASAIGRLFHGMNEVRGRTIAFEIVGAAGAAWSDDDGMVAEIGNDFLMRQTGTIGGGTTEMARNVISERVLGMPRERSDGPRRRLPRRPPGTDGPRRPLTSAAPRASR